MLKIVSFYYDCSPSGFSNMYTCDTPKKLWLMDFYPEFKNNNNNEFF